MDQWTSKSINLIIGEEIVSLTRGWVNKKNTQENYKNFCVAMERIAQEVGMSAEDTEKAMFSKGGRHKWDWKKYVIENYKKS